MEVTSTIYLIILGLSIYGYILFKREIIISLITLISLFYLDLSSGLILLSLTCLNYIIIKKYKQITIGIILTITVLIYYKLKLVSGNLDEIINNGIIPLGLAFYSLKIIGYGIEEKKEKNPNHKFVDFFNYMFFLPTLIIGPIDSFKSFKKEIDKKDIKKEKREEGFKRIIYGYSKIIIVFGFLLGTIWELIVIENIYTEQIHRWGSLYFAFSGFSDIAIGASLMMGIKIQENFNNPFFSKNIIEFWERWHISLSKWAKEYIYKPSVAITRNMLFSIILTMIFIGLWHSISWNYIIWGIYQGIGISIWYNFQKIKKYKIVEKLTKNKIFEIVSIMITFHFIILSFSIGRIIIKWIS